MKTCNLLVSRSIYELMENSTMPNFESVFDYHTTIKSLATRSFCQDCIFFSFVCFLFTVVTELCEA